MERNGEQTGTIDQIIGVDLQWREEKDQMKLLYCMSIIVKVGCQVETAFFCVWINHLNPYFFLYFMVFKDHLAEGWAVKGSGNSYCFYLPYQNI